MFPITLMAAKNIFESENQSAEQVEMLLRSLMANPFKFPGYWHFSAYCGGLLVALLGLTVIMHTCNEYTYKTHRQNIIDGWSRKQFVSAKVILIFTLSLIATVYYVILTLIMGSAYITDKTEMFNPQGLVFIFYFFIECLVYMTFALMIGILMKRTGLAIGLFFIYAYIADNILFGWLIKHGPGARFLPLDTADSLVNNQMTQIVPQFRIDDTLRMWLLIACIGYIIVYTAISYMRFLRKDL
jgi:ABC-type transport system involved in multi-copper enzyme maturation permease subunit